MLLEKAFIIAFATITIYFIGIAIAKPFWNTRVFCARTFFVILGALLGGLISTPFYGINDIAGYIALALTIAILLGLYYGGFFSWLWKKFPDSLKNALKTAGKIFLYGGLALLITTGLVAFLYYYFNT